MKFENYLLISKVELVISSICTIASIILLIVNIVYDNLILKQFFLIPILLGIAFFFIVVALLTELARYVKK